METNMSLSIFYFFWLELVLSGWKQLLLIVLLPKAGAYLVLYASLRLLLWLKSPSPLTSADSSVQQGPATFVPTMIPLF